MKAYLTSIGETTEQVCKSQLERFGFEVVLLDKKEPWIDKYKHFLEIADEDCIRIDADIIPNSNIKKIQETYRQKYLMVQYNTYDLYRNNIWATSPVFYRKQAIEIIKNNIDKLDQNRPETSAWRLPEMKGKTNWSEMVVGVHGWSQNKETVERAKQNKIDRGQINDYDFELYERIIKL